MIYHQISNSIGNYNYSGIIYENNTWSAHFHGNYELIYTFTGTTELTANGVPETLESGSFVLLSPYNTHSLKITDGSRAWIGVFSKDYIADFAQKYQFVNFSKFRCDSEIEQFLLKHLLHENATEHFLREACLYMICAQCIKNGEIRTSDTDTVFIKKVITYLTESIGQNITMKQIAKALNYEYHYFSNLFHNYFSMNFKKFINILRFEQACEMLSTEEYTITEVCHQCGFASIRNFNRIFKALAGMTPSEYKKAI